MNKMSFPLVIIFCCLIAHVPLHASETKHQKTLNKEDIVSKIEKGAPSNNAIKRSIDALETYQALQEQAAQKFRFRQLEERRFYVVVLAILSLASMLAVYYLIRSTSPSAEDIVLVMGLNLVVFGTIISVLIVDTTEQLGAVTGILGSMGGYLFGSKSRGAFGNKRE